jgi:hypothetical protein
MQSGVYSFTNFHASLAGPGGIISLGDGSASAEEGVTVEPVEDADKMMIGADGSVMHTLNPSKAAKITVRLLKTSPVNNLLSAMYNLQRLSSLTWGVNVLTMTDVVRGDNVVASGVAFLKRPSITWAKDGNMNEWEFNASFADALLGKGA